MTDASASAPLQRPARRHVASLRRCAVRGVGHCPQTPGITEEPSRAAAAGLFDVANGKSEVAGADALAAVQRISTNDASRLEVGQAQYSALATPEGTFVDDLLVYRLAGDHFMLVLNAANIAAGFEWIRGHIAGVGDAVAVNTSSRYALIASGARGLEQPLTTRARPSVIPFRDGEGSASARRSRAPATPARTGWSCSWPHRRPTGCGSR